MPQPTTKQYFFSPDTFKKVREYRPEVRVEELERMVKHKDHVAAGLRGVITKLYRQLKNN